MLKLRLNREDGQLVVLGLSYKNLEKLKDGQPIKFGLEPFGMQGELLIYAGETEQIMVQDLVDSGMVDPKAAQTMLRAMKEDHP